MSDTPLFEKYGHVVDSGKVIFAENQVGNVMFIIQEGSVRITKTIDGKPHILAVLGKGDFFGEMALVTNVKRTATATAVGTVKLLAFDRRGFMSMIEKNARIALNVIDKLCRRLQAANAQIQHLVKRNQKGLIALNLYYAFVEGGMENASLDVHKTSRDVALNLEIPQEDVMSYLQEVEHQGIVKVDKESNIVQVVDKAALQALAEMAGDSHGRPDKAV